MRLINLNDLNVSCLIISSSIQENILLQNFIIYLKIKQQLLNTIIEVH